MKKFLLPFLTSLFIVSTAQAEHQQGPGPKQGPPGQAQGQPQCEARSKVVPLLAKKYQELQIALGVTNTGGMIELFASKTGTWTIIITSPKERISCLVAAGEGWRQLEPKEPDGPEV